MRRCEECGCERLAPSERKIKVTRTGGMYRAPVEAVQCDDCGRMFPADPDWEAMRLSQTTAITMRPPSYPASVVHIDMH
jgi:uncharacterized protein with PIN domain